MIHIIVGFVLAVLGLMGIAYNWYMFIDLFWVLVPLAALLAGVVALLAGVSTFRER
jgi:ABC-type branched-subunit amino acid transport system permease subunit